ncbi:MAG: hypothetical protein WC047_03470 [Kiritimatiellales bacterium]
MLNKLFAKRKNQMSASWISILFGLVGVLGGSLISIWMTRHSIRFSETLRIVALLKDQFRMCLTDIRSSPQGNCPSDIILNCVRNSEALITQLKSLAKEATIKPILKAWTVFAYGDTPQHYDEKDTKHEYFSANGEVKKTRDKAIDRLNAILSKKL